MLYCYYVDSAVELGYLTPLEAVCLSKHPKVVKHYDSLKRMPGRLEHYELANLSRSLWLDSDLALKKTLAEESLGAKEVMSFIGDRVLVESFSVPGITNHVGHLMQHLRTEYGPLRSRLRSQQDEVLKLTGQKPEDGNELPGPPARYTLNFSEEQLLIMNRVLDPEPEIKKGELSQARRALKRAYAFFVHHGKAKSLSLFIGGGNVEVSHPSSSLKFSLKRHGDLQLEKGSVQNFTPWKNVKVSVLTKDDVFLGDICVYIKDTPVLDQLMSMMLLIEGGAEDLLLEKGNFLNLSPCAAAHPVVRKYIKTAAVLTRTVIDLPHTEVPNEDWGTILSDWFKVSFPKTRSDMRLLLAG